MCIIVMIVISPPSCVAISRVESKLMVVMMKMMSARRSIALDFTHKCVCVGSCFVCHKTGYGGVRKGWGEVENDNTIRGWRTKSKP